MFDVLAAIAAGAQLPDGWVFAFCLLGMVPLASMLGDITEELAKHTNQTVGGLLNATFGADARAGRPR